MRAVALSTQSVLSALSRYRWWYLVGKLGCMGVRLSGMTKALITSLDCAWFHAEVVVCFICDITIVNDFSELFTIFIKLMYFFHFKF